jgi:tetratricopeptide (TPR) repeat protein
MLRSYCIFVGGLALVAGMASPSYAGMSQDLSSCTAAKVREPAACSRIMNSGRLPREQMWIGYFNRGSANRHAGEYAKAVADFTQVVALNPSFARAYQSRGMAQDDLGARDKALIDLDKAIEVDPKDWSGFYSRAVVLRANGDSEPALRDLDTAAGLNNKMPQIPLMRALILADKGSYDAARAEITR